MTQILNNYRKKRPSPGLAAAGRQCSTRLASIAIGILCSAAKVMAVDFALEEITVTANKLEENLQSVSTTVTALTSERLQRLGQDDFEDFAQFVPGFDYQKQGVAQSQYVIRGASAGRVVPAQPQNRSLVGLYLNDLPMDLNGLNPDLDLYDTRVEVLKGPQGSLFGDSAMAGAVRYITNPADPTAFQGSALANVSTIDNGGVSHNVKGMVNIPIIEDDLALRAVAIYRDNAGWVDNVLLGTENANTEQTEAFRVSLRGMPTNDFTYDLMVLYQNTNAGTPPYDTSGPRIDRLYAALPSLQSELAALGIAPNFGPALDGIGGDFTFSRQVDESIKDEVGAFVGTLSHAFDWGEITSVTGYMERTVNNVLSELVERWNDRMTGLTNPGVSTRGNIIPRSGSEQPVLLHDWDAERFTQEIRLTSDLDGLFNATLGVYYSSQKIVFDNNAIAPGLDARIRAGRVNPFGFVPGSATTPQARQAAIDALGCADLIDHTFCGPEINKVEQIALFGEAYVQLSEQLKLTIGGRYYDYTQDYEQDFAGLLNFGRFADKVRDNESGFNPKFGLSFQANEDLLVYANLAKGFRLGGVSNVLPSFCNADLAALGFSREDVKTFDPDTLLSYELGVKSSHPGGRMTVNAAAYYTKWDDIQTTVNLGCGYIPVTNANAIVSQGLELESQFALSDGLIVFASLAYNDTSLDGDAPLLSAADGARGPYSPRFKGVSGLDYSRPIADGVVIEANLTVKYSSEAFDSFSRDNELFEQFVGNLRVAALIQDQYRITLFVDNFTNEYIASAARSRFTRAGRPEERFLWGRDTYYVGQPRTFGLEFSADF